MVEFKFHIRQLLDKLKKDNVFFKLHQRKFKFTATRKVMIKYLALFRLYLE